MKDPTEIETRYWSSSRTGGMDREIRRANARLRHFRGIAASVMSDAQALWQEIWDLLQDSRSAEEILDGTNSSACRLSAGEASSLVLEKLHLLGVLIDYAGRLCDGSIGDLPHKEGEQ
ncbi:MAG TPA: hypothetical protein PK250_17300 [Syntrophobacter fumaroxidans]|nr:hypothetical protein [Syntrophobacter fumaroxidans]